MNDKLKGYFKIMKVRLTLLVLFSAYVGYYMADRNESFQWVHFLLFSLAGFLITVSGNTINQIIEKESDLLMNRTMNRPIPLEIISIKEAISFASICLGASLVIFIKYINVNTAVLAFASFVLYSFCYTPLKKKHPIAVFVGAIPGALPPMLGWLAVKNEYGLEPGILFAIQFFWQFPHFWAIAWVLDEDYKRAGIRLLPGSGQDINTAFQIMIYTVVLIPLGFIPYYLKMVSIEAVYISTFCGVLFLIQTFYLMKTITKKAAMRIMFGSFVYLPIVQIGFLVYKI
jgi:protoheme IX farnesyltransferase